MQFYRKNFELSADAKEKLKNALFRAKNNYREVFVKDYQNWIKYESRGSYRLNQGFQTDTVNLLFRSRKNFEMN